jgi:hypothetical protein
MEIHNWDAVEAAQCSSKEVVIGDESSAKRRATDIGIRRELKCKIAGVKFHFFEGRNAGWVE